MTQISTSFAGIKFRPGAADIIALLDEGAELDLTPEPTNKYDPHAIMVSYSGANLGYVPAVLSEKVSGLIKEGRIDMVMYTTGNKFEIHHDGGLDNDE